MSTTAAPVDSDTTAPGDPVEASDPVTESQDLRRPPLYRRPLRLLLVDGGYPLLAGALLAVMVGVVSQHRWLSDWWIHLATVRQLVAEPGSLVDPLTGTSTPFPYYTPHSLLLGWIARSAGLTPAGVLEIAGLASLVLWLLALRLFVGAITPARGAATWTLALTLLLWGTGRFWWSGLTSLGSLSMGLAWPSLTAAALMLLSLAGAWRWLDRPGGWSAAAVIVLPPLVLLTHTFTGMLTCAGLALVFLGRLRRGHQLWPLAVAAAASLAAVSAWPYWSFWELVTSPSDFADIHANLYQHVGLRFGLMVIALPAVVLRLRRSWRDPLAWFVIVGGALVLLGWLGANATWGRAWPLVALGAHTALGVHLAERPTKRYITVVVVAMAVGLVGQLYGVQRATASGPTEHWAPGSTKFMPVPYPPADWISLHARPGDVVVSMSQFFTGRQLPAAGLRVVEPPWPDPLLPDFAARAEAHDDVLYRRRTLRSAALERYGVDWVVILPGTRWPGANKEGTLEAIGPDRSLLYRVVPDPGRFARERAAEVLDPAGRPWAWPSTD
jgi:alpha-1,6-mannosyltransferase